MSSFEFSYSVGVTSQALSSLPPTFDSVTIENSSASASVAVTFDGSTPAVYGAGFTLGPLGSLTWHPPLNTVMAINAIASAPSTPVSVVVN